MQTDLNLNNRNYVNNNDDAWDDLIYRMYGESHEAAPAIYYYYLNNKDLCIIIRIMIIRKVSES